MSILQINGSFFDNLDSKIHLIIKESYDLKIKIDYVKFRGHEEFISRCRKSFKEFGISINGNVWENPDNKFDYEQWNIL